MGMMVAVYSNARTTVSAMKEGARGWRDSFNTAFRAGAVMGFGLSSMALLVLFILIKAFETQYPLSTDHKKLFEAISGYGLGGSSIAMSWRTSLRMTRVTPLPLLTMSVTTSVTSPVWVRTFSARSLRRRARCSLDLETSLT
ncbi:H -translocating Pyrophosphatase (H -PPase) Family [Phytophthora infestans T30-4]|uniref:H(+)-exporting diphosphatase n=1 Tax=Phytophthora infestans (strain T30-4) TaxID=403677 RepID=D0RLY7_PHYIT|nr:H -translocating Pyrophosphatase (H -PPase) Family [Phytophthora infestans T30-4]EEY55447.1 H -translocating Pyrophosphatase (H -PPase) Family [Phytophthora infestans T30-4]|eukprot:XP_002909943.1 H -translocating Pyrophosphatase (H -PPase) Family [Phytophthora infestans T30-4]